jgi:hypothetical protein
MEDVKSIIDNSFIHDNWVGIKADYCNGSVMNTDISLNSYQGMGVYESELDISNCKVMGGESSYPDLYPNNIGIYGVLSNLTIHDCSISNTRVGIDDGYLSNVNIYNNVISYNYYGIFNYLASQFNVHDNEIMYNSYGIYSWDSNLNIYDNQLVGNYIGITYKQTVQESSDWDINIVDNVIADNSEWGIYALNNELEIDQNIFIDDEGNANGNGIYLQEYSLNIYVYDSYNAPITQARVEVRDTFGTTVMTGMTNTDGELNIDNVISYKISNENVKTVYTPHDVTVRWGTDKWGYISEQKSLELNKISNLTFKFKLPDIYISNEDIKVSKSRPESGDKVTIEVTVHYTGDMPASEVNVTITADSGIVDEIKIDRILSGESKKISAEWEVYSVSDSEVTIRVWVDPPWGFEYHKDEYLDNNNATIMVRVKGEDEPETGP